MTDFIIQKISFICIKFFINYSRFFYFLYFNYYATIISVNLLQSFQVLLIIYSIVSIIYTKYIKKIPILDILTLSFLYLLRLIAGGALLGITISNWLLTFSVFFFYFLLSQEMGRIKENK